MDDGAVLVGHLHHVRHRADGGQGAVAGEEGLLPLPPQGQHQLQGHAHARQVLEGVGAVAAAGVHHRSGLGQDVLALVVVGDDQIQADLPGVAGLLHAGDAAVHGDHQAHPPVPEGAQGLPPQAVAVLHPAGDVLQTVRPPGAQVVHQQHRGGDAVHVVVAEDGHPLAAGDGPLDARHGPVHVLHQKGGVGEAALPLQKEGRLLRGAHAPGRQDGGEQAGVPRAAQAAGGCRVPVPHNPFLKFHRSFPPSRPEPPAPPGGVKAAGSKIT